MSSECAMSGHHPSRVRLGTNSAVGPDNEAGADSSPDSAPDPAPLPRLLPTFTSHSCRVSQDQSRISEHQRWSPAWGGLGGLGWGGGTVPFVP